MIEQLILTTISSLVGGSVSTMFMGKKRKRYFRALEHFVKTGNEVPLTTFLRENRSYSYEYGQFYRKMMKIKKKVDKETLSEVEKEKFRKIEEIYQMALELYA